MRATVETGSAQGSGAAKIFALIIVAIQVAIFGLTYIASPGYVVPFLHDHIARIAIAVLILWQAIGLAIILLTGFRIWKAILVIMIFTMPLLLTPMLGPAIVTIINATGPIMMNPSN